ncbi:hypothetical protein [Rhodopirellula baltica]|uniref:Uncharacterized protein n=1 Tax=Rhodopirellula baltica SWK14 TaxID=993516 RepID=L7CPK5_RHOBT|nr:hypothetical protein [Rhodopirellula baltica]ELP35903.1 hypothetical protein RBSWK_00165 [Rhodopirellula baltica SWK14]
MRASTEIVVGRRGELRMIYDESFDLQQLGHVHIERGSHVEPTMNGQWTADLSPVGGPVLGPFALRSEAIEAEIEWLHCHWLLPGSDSPP